MADGVAAHGSINATMLRRVIHHDVGIGEVDGEMGGRHRDDRSHHQRFQWSRTGPPHRPRVPPNAAKVAGVAGVGQWPAVRCWSREVNTASRATLRARPSG